MTARDRLLYLRAEEAVAVARGLIQEARTEEIRRLLLAEGFRVSDSGKVTVGPKLRPQ